MNVPESYSTFFKTNKILKLEPKFYSDCGITVDGTLEYCETPKGPHFILYLHNFGALIKNSQVDNIFEANNQIIIDVLKQNQNINPTLTLIYDVTGMTNLDIMHAIPLIATLNKKNTELNKVAIPLGYKNFLAIIANGPGVKVLNSMTTMLPSTTNKPKTIYFNSLEAAQSTLDLIRTYGVIS